VDFAKAWHCDMNEPELLGRAEKRSIKQFCFEVILKVCHRQTLIQTRFNSLPGLRVLAGAICGTTVIATAPMRPPKLRFFVDLAVAGSKM